MFKRNLTLALMGMFMPSFAATPALTSDGVRRPQVGQPKGGKGQLRAARHKPSGVAAMKRAATKRNNIRKHG